MDLATLQHSMFLQALGGAIVSSLWQAFVLWFIYETDKYGNTPDA